MSPLRDKCRGCYHFDVVRSVLGACEIDGVIVHAERCGDGEDPEHGYAPLIGDSQGYSDYMRKKGLHYIVERQEMRAVPEEPQPGPNDDTGFRVEVLGDSALALSEGSPEMQKSDWAIATAAWQRVAPSKKEKFITADVERNKAKGEHVSRKKYKRRAPRSFKEHIMGKSIAMIEQEFGPDVAAVLQQEEELRNMSDLNPESRVYKALAGKMKSDASGPASHGALVGEFRKNQMKRPHPDSKAKAAQHGGGSVFHHSALSGKAGVPVEHVKKMALNSHHADHFLQRVRAQFGESVKDLSDGQIRSAYHSTGLRHSLMVEDLNKGRYRQPGACHTCRHTVRAPEGMKMSEAGCPKCGGKLVIPRIGGGRGMYHSGSTSSYKFHDQPAIKFGTKTKKSEENMDDLVKCNDNKKKMKKRHSDEETVEKGRKNPHSWMAITNGGKNIAGADAKPKVKLPKSNPKQAAGRVKRKPANLKNLSGPPHSGNMGHSFSRVSDDWAKSEETDAIGLMDAADLFEKSMGKKDRCIGHTTSGKAVCADGAYHKNFSSEDHMDAEEIHDALSAKLNQAAQRWGDKPLPPGSRKHLQAMADHHRSMAMGHGRKARPVNGGPSIAAEGAGIKIPAHFGLEEAKTEKSLGNNVIGGVPSSAFDLVTTKRFD